ncbi:MFS transporter [Puerhibacterium sp. TATVAM-FAB25]|uniref:MFS transporter n=1 Tax=Puerhibacterium sp. TATVAM-FAB25 TaxID=3093699 RepID=UPI00397E1D5D
MPHARPAVTAPHPTATDLSPHRRWAAVAVLMLGAAIALLDTTIVNVALPTIRSSLQAPEATLQWIISGYALAYGLALIPAGRVGDRVGHRWVYLAGIAGFTLASWWCAQAGGPTELVVARVAQGLCGGIFFPAVGATIQVLFTGRDRGRAFGALGAVIGVASAAGPLVGGVLIEQGASDDAWRSIFYVNLPFGALAVLGALLLLPRGAARRPAGPQAGEQAGARAGEQAGAQAPGGTDLGGLVLLTAALVALLVPLIQGEGSGWPPWTWLSLAGGAALLAAFGAFEVGVARRGRVSPLVPPRLFSHRAFTGGVVLALVYFAAFTSIFFTISILWQTGLGHSALESGLVSIPFALGSIVSAAQSARLAERLGRGVLVLGAGMVAAGLVSLWLLLAVLDPPSLTHWTLLPSLAVAGLGSGMFIAPNQQFIVATVDPEEAGAAAGVIGTAQRIGSAAGIAVIGSVLFGSLTVASGSPADLAAGFGHAAAMAMAVSAAFSVAAFALVFALPRRPRRG